MAGTERVLSSAGSMLLEADTQFHAPLSGADRKELRGLLLRVMRTCLLWLDEG
jgi:hypothetical protein